MEVTERYRTNKKKGTLTGIAVVNQGISGGALPLVHASFAEGIDIVGLESSRSPLHFDPLRPRTFDPIDMFVTSLNSMQVPRDDVGRVVALGTTSYCMLVSEWYNASSRLVILLRWNGRGGDERGGGGKKASRRGED
ncbi:hypothetical protein M407DRAFT_199730 [Tulasnella calospora MUT 4182]|uniref:Uncharacterized protein n=1 Tax=Tulasnella calospora MUT 4182 TaxID=1051891 RepID=A0A0C3QII6_9AGAM|nr:hypothetical protein M407DRAFT_199730 [Tulasnella calospora MUT 4182]